MNADPAHEGAAEAPSEEELRAAYEEELNRITSTELMLQSAVSLLNLGGRRLGAPPGAAPAPAHASAQARDLEQVRDAIDGVRALLGVLERRLSTELGPLRDALSQLQLAYARAAREASTSAAGAQETTAAQPSAAPDAQPPSEEGERGAEQSSSHRPGPAESSGRLWVPGR